MQVSHLMAFTVHCRAPLFFQNTFCSMPKSNKCYKMFQKHFQVMNRHDYVPKMPSQAELELVFDTTFPDIQPYLFKISYATSGPNSPSMGTTVRRLLKDTLAI